jgi:translation initiation factor 3 subunit M
MPGARNTILIEGSFEELTDEFAQYIDTLKKGQGDESDLQGEAAALLKENKKDDVLKKLVVGSQALNQAPEKGRRTRRCDRLG